LFHPTGLCVEEEPPSYDMDTEDEEWLNAQSRDRVFDNPLLVFTLTYGFHLAIVTSTF